MRYEDVENAEQLLSFMDCIEYGFETIDGKRYYGSDEVEKHINEWTLQDAKRLCETKLGHCFDQVELERDWFSKHNYEFKTILVGFLKGNYPTHSFLAYKENSKWFYFEHSDYSNKGIFEYNSLTDIIEFVKKELIKYCGINEKDMGDYIVAYQYDKLKNNISFSDFIYDVSSKEENIIQ